jgi:hypothetical protein
MCPISFYKRCHPHISLHITIQCLLYVCSFTHIGIFIHKMVTKWMIIFVHYEMKDFVSLVAQNWDYNPHPCASLPRSFLLKIQESKGLKRVPPEQSKSRSVISYNLLVHHCQGYFPLKIQESKGLKRVPPEQSKSWSVISYEVIFSFSCLQCSFLKLAMLASQLETQ